jgi:hypothetical protein
MYGMTNGYGDCIEAWCEKIWASVVVEADEPVETTPDGVGGAVP